MASLLRYSNDLSLGFLQLNCRDGSFGFEVNGTQVLSDIHGGSGNGNFGDVPLPPLQPYSAEDSFNQSVAVYCKGVASVYRFSFALTLFFAAMAVLSTLWEGFHRGLWFFKLICLTGVIIGALFMPPGNFNESDFAWVARFGGCIFLVIQLFFLIDFAYGWNDSWVARADRAREDDGDVRMEYRWLMAILIMAAMLYTIAVVGLILMFIFYSQCGEGVGFSVSTLLVVILATTLTLNREQLVGIPGAILPAAVVSAYAVYLCWSALESHPDPTCRATYASMTQQQQQQQQQEVNLGGSWSGSGLEGNETASLLIGPSTTSSSYLTLNIVLGSVIAAITLMWSVFSTSTSAVVVVVAAAGDVQGSNNHARNANLIVVRDPEVADLSYQASPALAASTTTSSTGGPITQFGSGSGPHSLPPPPPPSVLQYTPNGNAIVSTTSPRDDQDAHHHTYGNETRLWMFHGLLLFASMYLAMLLTDWGAASDHPLIEESIQGNGGVGGHATRPGGGGSATMWMKIATQWLVWVLYIWTIVAPKVLGRWRTFDS